MGSVKGINGPALSVKLPSHVKLKEVFLAVRNGMSNPGTPMLNLSWFYVVKSGRRKLFVPQVTSRRRNARGHVPFQAVAKVCFHCRKRITHRLSSRTAGKRIRGKRQNHFKDEVGKPKPGAAKFVAAKAAARRKETNKGHDIFLMPAENI